MEQISVDTSKQLIESEDKARKVNPVLSFFMIAYTPTFTWRSTILLYFLLGIASLLYGLIISSISAGVIEYAVDYTALCNQATCSIPITITSTMTQPVFLYYGLDGFYQNHRLYIKSHNAQQLAGHDISLSTANSSCFPATTNEQMSVTTSWNGSKLTSGAIASPCGLVARSFFNDTYQLTQGTKTITLDDSNIAWPNDAGVQFKRSPTSGATQWIDPENQHFIVWMRPASNPNFRKLWAIINEDLVPGEYTITVQNNYNVTSFSAQKSVILTTASVFGSRYNNLNYVFFSTGVVMLLTALFFAKNRNR